MSMTQMLAKALVADAFREFGPLIFNEDFANRHALQLTSVPRCYAAALALLENSVSRYVDAELQLTDKSEFQIAVRLEFSIYAYRFSFDEIVSLRDLVVAPFEREATEKNYRRMGRSESIDVLMMMPAPFGSHYQTIQDVRCAEFLGILLGSNATLQDALHRSFSFWYFGRDPTDQSEYNFVHDVADNAEWVAALIVDRAKRGDWRKP